MYKISNLFLTIIIVVCSIFSCKTAENNIIKVTNLTEFNEAVSKAQPGNTIVLANGIWKNVELIFEGKGTKENPIKLTVEDKGKVTIEGQSNLQLAGEYLIVEGLVFVNGFTPTNEVISFRKSETELANNSRLTECVIDNFTNPERHDQDYWIVMYGKNNRVDHNHISGKQNLGVTMVVGLDTEASRENFHKIDHNYFGPRPTFGANGGETLRIGTSHYSLTNSNTLVESNYFDRCNGEHEIISNKACQNTFKYNVFYECTGTLTMRHGNETMVDGNVFIGNNKPSTGGVRVINEKQTVINNYHIGLTGYRFRGAFVMMNGVPNSTPNRYFQVTDAVVKNNMFVNCDNIQLCAGSDAERSATPINSVISENTFYHDTKSHLFTIYDDISGISFENNTTNELVETGIANGFTKSKMQLVKNDQSFLLPSTSNFKISQHIATKENTGVSWYSKEDKTAQLNSGKVIKVPAGINTIFNAVEASSPGDILELTNDEPYLLTKKVAIKHPLTVTSKDTNKPIILFEKMVAFEIQNGGSLAINNIKFNGAKSPDYAGNAVISTSKNAMIANYKLFIDNCEFENLTVNHSFDVLRVAKSTFADTISIQNSTFKNITGHIMALDKETDDIGVYNAEYVIVKNNTFADVQGSALMLYRGGTDESTFGPFLELEHNVFDNVGNGKRNKYTTAISLYGVQEIAINNNIFSNSKSIAMHLVVGDPIVNVLNNNLFNSDAIKVTGDQKYTIENVWNFNPIFETNSYKLSNTSPLKNKATNGLDLGLISN
jgi:poly(beta-D-mannuronate) lyase